MHFIISISTTICKSIEIFKTLPLCTSEGYAISFNSFELYLKTEGYIDVLAIALNCLQS